MRKLVAFRADASLKIGTGHVMRCLTLADALSAIGFKCHFLCRNHIGNMISYIRERGYNTHVLAASDDFSYADFGESAAEDIISEPLSTHSYHTWLGVTQLQDAVQSCAVLRQLQPQWLIVDHYALDALWETKLQSVYGKLMVIDDLANRKHNCDVLLDQTLGRQDVEYQHIVPLQCRVLTGVHYALLRPEFLAFRDYSLNRRLKSLSVQTILVSMGGIDEANITEKVLRALTLSQLPRGCQVTVIMGEAAPWLTQIRACAAGMPVRTEVLVNVRDMARHMANSDLIIGAAGSTSWERCCLGVPTVMVILADNQLCTATALQAAKAVALIQNIDDADELSEMVQCFVNNSQLRFDTSMAARALVDGEGVSRVLRVIGGPSE